MMIATQGGCDDAGPGTHEQDAAPMSVVTLNVGRRVYFLETHRNESGVFLRIVEKRGKRRSFVIVPEESLAAFVEALCGATRAIGVAIDPLAPRGGT